MGIATLGKSLLSSAKKKAKKGQQLGLFAGAAIGIAGAVNRGIREKAVLRAQQWDQSFTPLINSYAKEFTTINDIKTEFKDRNDTTKYANYQESFYEPEIKRLTKLVAGGETDKTLSPKELADIRVQAIENVSDNILKYETQVEQYKPYFDLDKEAFDKNLTALRAKGVKLISDDSLKKRIGRKFFGSTEGQQLVKKIKMSDTESMDISLPQELMAAMDTTFLNSLAGIKTRSVKVSDVKIIREAYSTPEEIELLQKKILRDPPAKSLTKDTENAVINIFNEFDKETDLENNPIPNVDYLEFINFANADNKIVPIRVQDLKTILQSTFAGGKPRVKPEQNFSDWDQYMKDVGVATQIQEIEYLRKNRSEVVTQQLRNQFAALAAVEVAGTFDITFKTGNVGFGKYNPLRMLPGPGMKEGIISSEYKGRKGSKVPNEEGLAGDTNTLDTSGTFNAVNLEKDSISFDVEAAKIDFTTPEFKAMSQKDKSNYFSELKIMHPESVTEINELRQSVLAPKPLEKEMQENLSADMTRVDGTKKSSTGFKGPITNNVDKSTMTEVSVGVMINGKETLVPAINELTTDAQIKVLQDLKIGVDPIPEDIQITAKKAAEARIEAGLNPFYQDEEEKNNTTTTTSTSLLNPSVPTQAELVKEFEILGASKMSSEEIDIRLNEMINQKEDFTTDEYIKLITYLNSKQGINPKSSNTSLLEPTKELTDSEIIAGALKGTGRNPLEVLRDSKINNLEKAVARMKAGKPNIGTSSSAVVRWLKNTKDTDYYKLSTEERIASTEEYIETLKS